MVEENKTKNIYNRALGLKERGETRWKKLEGLYRKLPEHHKQIMFTEVFDPIEQAELFLISTPQEREFIAEMCCCVDYYHMKVWMEYKERYELFKAAEKVGTDCFTEIIAHIGNYEMYEIFKSIDEKEQDHFYKLLYKLFWAGDITFHYADEILKFEVREGNIELFRRLAPDENIEYYR